MATSALNSSGKNVYPGYAVAGVPNGIKLAGGSTLATALAADGAPPRGVVTLITAGILDLNDWTLATGSKSLKIGQTYYAGQNGTLSTNPGSQAVGIAVSATQLSVQISQTPVPYIVVQSSLPSQQTANIQPPFEIITGGPGITFS